MREIICVFSRDREKCLFLYSRKREKKWEKETHRQTNTQTFYDILIRE